MLVLVNGKERQKNCVKLESVSAVKINIIKQQNGAALALQVVCLQTKFVFIFLKPLLLFCRNKCFFFNLG